MNKTTAGLSAFGLVLFLALGVVITVLIAGLGHPMRGSEPLFKDSTPTRPTKLTPAEERAPTAPPVAVDPWPECKEVRVWFSQNVGDPASIEVLKWEDRREVSWTGKEGRDRSGNQTNDPPGSAVIIRARYRGKNQYGGMQVEVRSWSFSGSKLNWSEVIAH